MGHVAMPIIQDWSLTPTPHTLPGCNTKP